MPRVLQSRNHRARVRSAAAFLREQGPGEALLVGATREAVDDLAMTMSAEGAIFGIHRFSAAQLIARLAREKLAELGLAPATLLAVEAVAARVVHEVRADGLLDRYASVSAFPGFARSLAATLTELRLAEMTAARITLQLPESGELAALLQRFTEALAESALADRPRLIELALASLAGSPFAGWPVVLLDVPIGSRLEARFWGSLLRSASASLITVAPDDAGTHAMLTAESMALAAATSAADTDGTHPLLASLQRELFKASATVASSPGEGDGSKARTAADPSVEVFSAPGEGRECVEIARRILASATPFDRIGVLLRTPDVYHHQLDTALRRAGIPVYFARGTRRPDPAGRAFLALLACASERLSARRFAEYLSFSQVPTPGADGGPPASEVWVPADEETLVATVPTLPRPVSAGTFEDPDDDEAERSLFAKSGADVADDPPTLAGSLRAPWKWEEYLVESAVIRGFDRWERRTRGYGRELALQIEQLQRVDPESPRLSGLQRDLENLGHLQRFALPVIRVFADWPAEARWGEWLDELSALAPRVVRRPERVLAVLAELEPMREVGSVSLTEVREVLWSRLSLLESDPPVSRFGRVFVATPEQARGRDFDLVFVPGLAERLFPQPPREDPLLLDEARQALGADLQRQDDRARRERLQLALAIGAASQSVVLSYPRLELTMARPRVPSFYCLEVARATQGKIPDLDTLERDAAESGRARLAWPAPPNAEDAIDSVEHDLSVLGPLLARESRALPDQDGQARYLLSLNPHLARSLRVRYQRWRVRKWTPADGLTRAPNEIAPILARHRLGERPYSVTALENFAVCPYRFLLAAIHRLEPRAEAAALVRMDPLTRGSLIHEIQAIALRRLSERGELPVTEARWEEAERELVETVQTVAARFADEVAPAIERVWQDEIDGITADLKSWLRRMVDEPWTPLHFELAFGLPPGVQKQRDAGSVPDPVRLAGGWLLRGAVDLVERDGERLRVTDHKTGRNRTAVGTVTAGGKVLQPVLYGLAVESLLGGSVESSRLYFCTTRGGFTERVVHLDERSRLFGAEALQWIDEAVGSGHLPALPEEDACRTCDFRVVCGPSEESRTARKPKQAFETLRDVRGLP